MGKPFTAERLANIRRIRKARRLHKAQPLFAYHLMRMEVQDYSHKQFCEDLCYRKPPKRRTGKSPLSRYGRYGRMEQLLSLYRNTGEKDYALQAQRLRNNMTKPYRVLVRLGGEVWEYDFSAKIPIGQIETLTHQINRCSTEKEADLLVEQFRKSACFGL